MIKNDFHTHTTYCDGKNTPEEMVLAAIEKGMECYGFSGHAYTPGEELYCMSHEGTIRYQKEVRRLKDKYSGKLKIYLGVELDYHSTGTREGFEYFIGSVHYFARDGMKFPVDESPDIFSSVVSEVFGGDYYAAAENYYSYVGDVLRRTGADIIGHFDLITKFNEGGRLFDTRHPRYVAAWQQAADRLLRYGKPFEINTGAITRGYRTLPYPEADIIDYIGERGGSFILSSDSHAAGSLMYGFEEWEAYVTDKGYNLLDMPKKW